MRLPFVRPYPHAPYNKYQLDQWVRTYNPAQIEMDDRQYDCFATFMGSCKKDFNGIPIVFLGPAQ